MASLQTQVRGGRSYYYVVWRDPAKGRSGQRWLYAGTDPEEARIRLKEIELRQAKGDDLTPTPKPSCPLFSTLVQGFLAYARVNLAPKTFQRYALSLRTFRAFLKDDLPSDRITPAILEDFKASRASLSWNTMRNDLNALKAVYGWAVRLGHVQAKPTDKVRLRRPEHNKPPEFLTLQEVQKLMELARSKPRDYAIFSVMLRTGVRASELYGLKWPSVDLEGGRMVVLGKGGKYRTIPLGRDLCQILAGMPRTGPFLFYTRAGKPLGFESLKMLFKRYSERLGRHIHPHLMRHTFATHLMASCRNPAVVQQALGHSSITTTMIYAHVQADLLAQAVQGLDYKAPPKALPAKEVA